MISLKQKQTTKKQKKKTKKNPTKQTKQTTSKNKTKHETTKPKSNSNNKKISVGLRLDILKTDIFETWHDNRYYSTLHCYTSLHDLDLFVRSQLYEKSNVSVFVFLQISQSTLMKCRRVLQLVS